MNKTDKGKRIQILAEKIRSKYPGMTKKDATKKAAAIINGKEKLFDA